MEDYRSRSYPKGRMQIETYASHRPPPPPPPYDPRSFGTSHTSSSVQKDVKLKKGKSSSWIIGGWFNDPEIQRRKRIAGYKVYSVEGKVKGSLTKSFRWLKVKYSQVVDSWR